MATIHFHSPWYPQFGRDVTFELYSDAHCPKCGQQTVWYTAYPVEDNAGEYCICTSCFHDWHMYGLGGYYGVEHTRKYVEEILRHG